MLVDYSEPGQVIGLEITAPDYITLEKVNALLLELELPPLDSNELAPLRAA